MSVLSIGVLLAACNGTTQIDGDGMTASSSSSIVDSMEASSSSIDGMEASSSSSVDGMETDVEVDVDAGTSDARVIELTTKNFEFSPNAISLTKGEKVKLRLTGTEGNHGIRIDDLGINVTIDEGETVEIEIPTDVAGTFAFRCSVPCGPGHKDMTGTITIQA